MKYRVRRYDAKNWVIERYIEPKDDKSAKKRERSWKIIGYYGRLTDALPYLADLLMPEYPNLGELQNEFQRALDAAMFEIGVAIGDEQR